MTTQVWDCADTRISLGVYVLGAIDPAERALVDAHLATCRDCRDELANLAGLPALLARVNPEELSRIDAEAGVRTDDQPPRELVGAVLDLAAARRRRGRWRYAAAAAAVAAAAAGVFGGLAANQAPAALRPVMEFAPGTGTWDHAQASNPQTDTTADIAYAGEHWGTALAAEVDGIPLGTTCQMWIRFTDGSREYAMSWTTAEDEGSVYYWGSIPITSKHVASFEITTGHEVLVIVPA
jgi:hypothetical protein